MKHSNWILGIGVIVALILIIGSLFYKVDRVVTGDIGKEGSATTISIKPTTNFIFTTLNKVPNYLLNVIR